MTRGNPSAGFAHVLGHTVGALAANAALVLQSCWVEVPKYISAAWWQIPENRMYPSRTGSSARP